MLFYLPKVYSKFQSALVVQCKKKQKTKQIHMYSILNLSQIWLFRLSMAFIAWNVCTMPTQIWNYSSYTTTFFLLVAYTISSTVCKHLWQNGARVSQNIPLSTSHALECLFLPLCTSSWSFSAFQDALSELDQIGEDSWESLGLQGDPTRPS